jgi:hypothetical protein
VKKVERLLYCGMIASPRFDVPSARRLYFRVEHAFRGNVTARVARDDDAMVARLNVPEFLRMTRMK